MLWELLGWWMFLGGFWSAMRGKRDLEQCRMSYMWPGFRPVEMTRLGNVLDIKYALYIYEEGGVQRNTGIPLLFVHGNAGSYRQVRSLGSELYRLGHDARMDGFVVYTVDLHEELSALDIYTIQDQSRYLLHVLNYIRAQHSDIAHFPIVCHSFGGIVIKHALLNSPFYHLSWTIYTLATPHSAPPVAIQRQIVSLYESIHARWALKMENTLLISLAGGTLDKTVNSGTCHVGKSIAGVNLFTTEIDHVWTGADHRALVWCNQLVHKLAAFLLKNPFLNGTVPERRKSVLKALFIASIRHPLELLQSTTDATLFKTHSQPENNKLISISFDNETEAITWRFSKASDFEIQVLSPENVNSQLIVCSRDTCMQTLLEKSLLPWEPDWMKNPAPRRTGSGFLVTSRELDFPGPWINATIVLGPSLPGQQSHLYMVSDAKCHYDISFSFLDLLIKSEKRIDTCLYTHVTLQGIRESLWMYRLYMNLFSDGNRAENWEPIVLQKSRELKYLYNISDTSLSFYHADESIQLGIWSQQQGTLFIKIGIDVFGSLGRMISHYPGAWLGCISALVLWRLAFIVSNASLKRGIHRNSHRATAALFTPQTEKQAKVFMTKFHSVQISLLISFFLVQNWTGSSTTHHLLFGHHNLSLVTILPYIYSVSFSFLRLLDILISSVCFMGSFFGKAYLGFFIKVQKWIALVIFILLWLFSLPHQVIALMTLVQYLFIGSLYRSENMDAIPPSLIVLVMTLIVRLPFDFTSFLVWTRNFEFGFWSKPTDQILALPFLVHMFLGRVSQMPDRRAEPILTDFGARWLLSLCCYMFGWVCLAYGWQFTFIIQEITLIVLTGWAIQMIWISRQSGWTLFRSDKSD